jgi:Uma2 family endonuclease
MAVQIQRKRFTTAEYDKMVEAGVFEEDARLELIEGEIVEMAPIGLRHASCVARVQLLFHEQLGRRAIVWVQSPVDVGRSSRPQPDVALVQWSPDFYATHRPSHREMLLVVEVADSSLEYDRGVKLPLYAASSIPVVWIVNLRDDVIEVYSQPSGSSYGTSQRCGTGDVVPLPGEWSGTAIAVSDIIPS